MNNYQITLSDNDLAFAKIKPEAVIPTKEEENAGRDVYACFDEDYMIIPPFSTKLVPTGIASAFSSKYEIRLRDRGSNGSKGIHVNAGTIDSGYRGEWFVAWCNTNNKPVILSKLPIEELEKRFFSDQDEDTYDYIFYPAKKAIAQAEVHEVPVMNQFEIDYESLLKIESKRGTGSLGSSGK